MKPTTGDLIRQNRHAWNIALRNPFIDWVRDGNVEPERLARWFVQARARANSLYPLLCRLLAMAPREDREVFLDVLASMLAEFRWLDVRIRKSRVVPATALNPVVRSQIAYITALGFQPYVVGLVFFWGDLRLYAEAWSSKRPPSGGGQHRRRPWSRVRSLAWRMPLERAADRALGSATPKELAAVDAAFRRLIEDRLAFWAVTMS